LHPFYGRIGELERNLVVGRVDHQQQIAFVHELIVDHGKLDDTSGDLRTTYVRTTPSRVHGVCIYVFHIAQPNAAATVAVTSVIKSGTILKRRARIGRFTGFAGTTTGRSAGSLLSRLASTSVMARSACDDEHH
jgi:hypothetical protein